VIVVLSLRSLVGSTNKHPLNVLTSPVSLLVVLIYMLSSKCEISWMGMWALRSKFQKISMQRRDRNDDDNPVQWNHGSTAVALAPEIGIQSGIYVASAESRQFDSFKMFYCMEQSRLTGRPAGVSPLCAELQCAAAAMTP
jgi:hypothetical protein